MSCGFHDFCSAQGRRPRRSRHAGPPPAPHAKCHPVMREAGCSCLFHRTTTRPARRPHTLRGGSPCALRLRPLPAMQTRTLSLLTSHTNASQSRCSPTSALRSPRSKRCRHAGSQIARRYARAPRRRNFAICRMRAGLTALRRSTHVHRSSPAAAPPGHARGRATLLPPPASQQSKVVCVAPPHLMAHHPATA